LIGDESCNDGCDEVANKRHGLELLVRKHEPQPETVLARLAGDEETVRNVAIVRITGHQRKTRTQREAIRILSDSN
jgi:hypothetical protein